MISYEWPIRCLRGIFKYQLHTLLENKKVISFDGDGTLWYPKETKRSIAPHGIYALYPDTYLEHLELTPGAKELLSYLHEQKNIKVVILSTHPQLHDEALAILKKKIEYFGLQNICDFFTSSPDIPEGKGPILKKYIDEVGLSTHEALHIGDSIRYDFEAMKKVGIDVVLLNAPYNLKLEGVERIHTLEDLYPFRKRNFKL